MQWQKKDGLLRMGKKNVFTERRARHSGTRKSLVQLIKLYLQPALPTNIFRTTICSIFQMLTAIPLSATPVLPQSLHFYPLTIHFWSFKFSSFFLRNLLFLFKCMANFFLNYIYCNLIHTLFYLDINAHFEHFTFECFLFYKGFVPSSSYLFSQDEQKRQNYLKRYLYTKISVLLNDLSETSSSAVISEEDLSDIIKTSGSF